MAEIEQSKTRRVEATTRCRMTPAVFQLQTWKVVYVPETSCDEPITKRLITLAATSFLGLNEMVSLKTGCEGGVAFYPKLSAAALSSSGLEVGRYSGS